MVGSMLTGLRRQINTVISGTKLDIGNPEIEEYAQKLLNISSSLEESSRGIIQTETEWRNLFEQMRMQSENFVNVYPDDDEQRDTFRASAEACAKVGTAYSNEDLTLPGRRIDFKVQEYLIEVNTVLRELKALEDARGEYMLYAEKVNTLERARRRDSGKLLRFEGELERAKTDYAALCDDILQKMKRIYNKRRVMYNAAYVSYWRTQMTLLAMFQEQMQSTLDHVTKEQNKFLHLDVAKLS